MKTLEEYRVDQFAEFDKQGEDHVRLLLSQGRLSGSRQKFAIEWLAVHDEQARVSREASQAESLETAKSAKDAAWAAADAAREAAREARNANTIAALALAGAMIAIAVSIVTAFVG